MMVLGMSPLALAQLPPDVFNTPRPLTSQQVAALKDFVQKNLAGLKSKDSRELADARRSLLDPVRRDTSRTFRMAYNDALTPGLTVLAKDEQAEMANRQAAIWILGSVASDDSDAALRDVLESKVPALRYAAATAFERSMQANLLDRNAYSNALQSEKDVARILRTGLETETDAEVLRALLAAAAALPTVANALDTISDGLVAQARRLRDADSPACLNSMRIGLERMQKRYVVDTVGGPAIAPHEHRMIEAAADVLLLVVRHGKAEKITDENRDTYSNLARTSENLLSLLCKRDSAQTRVSNAVAAGRYDDADAALKSTWLAGDGPIYSNRVWEFEAGSIEAAFNR